MKFLSETLHLKTECGPQFIDITERVAEAACRAGVDTGFALIFSKHTTAAIRINESEPHLLRDMVSMLENVASASREYAHNKYAHSMFSTNGDRPNGHSHCQHLLLGAGEVVPISEGQLTVGQWQRIFLVELDHARERDVVIQVVGE